MGRANKRKRAVVFRWSLLVGLLIGLAFGALLYFLNKPGVFKPGF